MGVKIIAEVAQGYEGKPEQTRLLARAGVAGAADAVKFQCIYADEVSVPEYKFYPFLQTLEMPLDVWNDVAGIVHDAGRELIINVSGERSLEVAARIGADAVKVHSTNFFNDDLLRDAFGQFPRVYVSLGGIAPEEVEDFIVRHDLRPGGKAAFTYGFQASPTPVEKNHLRKLGALARRFPGFALGFEDHTDAASPDRFVVPLMALPFGLHHLEKHITLDPGLQLEDAESALSPTDFAAFVDLVRRLEPALGEDGLDLNDVEHDYRRRVLKVCVAAARLAEGAVLGPDNVVLKRVPATAGNAFLRREVLYGRVMARDLDHHQQITPESLQ